ncbi:ABC transporter permease [Halobacteriales archaeon QH_1_68_42]|nr:MAG: ABC transporter permease [Halobacteriales archaeon QH_1_68_42]
MSTKRGRIEIRGFHSEPGEERAPVSDWTEGGEREVTSRWARVARTFRRDRLALFGGIIVGLMVFAALFSRPLTVFDATVQPFEFVPYDPTRTRVGDPWAAPSLDHPMGTDRLGRDMFSRVMFGTRFSVTIGLIVTAVAVTFGTVYGAVSGYAGGRVDDLLMRVVDLVFAFPALVLVLVIVAMLGRGYWQLVVGFAAVSWATYARLIRGEILKVKQNEYVLAAKALGARDRRVLFGHVVPNAIAPVIVQATLSIGTVVIGVAALGFLGVGFAPGTPEWGTILNAHRDTIVGANNSWDRWWVTVFPGLMIFVFVMSMNMIGDAINDALDAQGEEDVDPLAGG